MVTSLEELIGNTPMVRLRRIVAPGAGEVFAKCEWHNPGFSVKDRTALGMIEAAEASGLLAPGGTIVEPTAGNTGIGLALVGVGRGYRVILVVPDKYSREKMVLMRALGGEVVLTAAADGMEHAIDRAYQIAESIPNAHVPQQFNNPSNPQAHYDTTGPEIWQQMEGRIDALVIGCGTGGTFSGCARYLKEQQSSCLMVAVEPQGSVIGGGEPGDHRVEGIGSSVIHATLDMSLVDEVFMVHDPEAFETTTRLGAEEGILAGSSGGAAAYAAVRIADRLGPGSRVATLIPDSGERYLSQGLYEDPMASQEGA